MTTQRRNSAPDFASLSQETVENIAKSLQGKIKVSSRGLLQALGEQRQDIAQLVNENPERHKYYRLRTDFSTKPLWQIEEGHKYFDEGMSYVIAFRNREVDLVDDGLKINYSDDQTPILNIEFPEINAQSENKFFNQLDQDIATLLAWDAASNDINTFMQKASQLAYRCYRFLPFQLGTPEIVDYLVRGIALSRGIELTPNKTDLPLHWKAIFTMQPTSYETWYTQNAYTAKPVNLVIKAEEIAPTEDIDQIQIVVVKEMYEVPKPTKTWGAILSTIALRIVFPPLLAWDAAKAIANLTDVGKTLGERFIPAQDKSKGLSQINIQQCLNKDEQNYLSAKKIEVITHDKAHLDTIQFESITNKLRPSNKRQYIINFIGYDKVYEDPAIISEMKTDAKDLNCDVIGFNFRGVNNSTGIIRSKDDLLTDGIAQVQRLIDIGVPPENITLKGHDFGAGIATEVAKYFHDHGQKINIFSIDSFSTMSDLIAAQQEEQNKQAVKHLTNDAEDKVAPKPQVLWPERLNWVPNFLKKFTLNLFNWEIDAASAYKAIPNRNKEYIVNKPSKYQYKMKEGELRTVYTKTKNEKGEVVKKDKTKITIDTPKNDSFIPRHGSLHYALKDDRKIVKQEIRLEHTRIKGQLKKLRKDLSTEQNRGEDKDTSKIEALKNEIIAKTELFEEQFRAKRRLRVRKVVDDQAYNAMLQTAPPENSMLSDPPETALLTKLDRLKDRHRGQNANNFFHRVHNRVFTQNQPVVNALQKKKK